MLILNQDDTCILRGWQPEQPAFSSSFNSDLPHKNISPWETDNEAKQHLALASSFYLCSPFLALFLNYLTCAISLNLEVPCGFLLDAVSSILGNKNSINSQVDFMGPCQAIEGIIAVGLDTLVIATKHPSNQYCKTLRCFLAPEWIYIS